MYRQKLYENRLVNISLIVNSLSCIIKSDVVQIEKKLNEDEMKALQYYISSIINSISKDIKYCFMALYFLVSNAGNV